MKQQTERRLGQDRRQLDDSLTDGRERRRRIEQRKMEIVELTISEAEWQMLFAPPRAVAPLPFREDAAASVFERAGSRSRG